jgi:hypothetical protein
MSRTVTYFPYSELPPDIQEKALENFIKSPMWMTWSDDWISQDITEMSLQTLTEAGYEVNTSKSSRGVRTTHDINWSCSYSQGDGFSWASKIDLPVVAKRLLSEDDFLAVEDVLCNISASTRQVGHHSRSTVLEFEDEDPEPETGFDMVLQEMRQRIIKELEAAIESDIDDMESQLSTDGYAEIEFQQSAERALETLQNNDHIEFDEDGELQ